MTESSKILLQLQTIQNRLELLVIRIKETEEKLKNAEVENTELKILLKQQGHNLKNLQKNQGNEQKNFQKREFFAKLVQNTGGTSDDKSELKKALDNYIKEIESCIAKLSN